MAKPRHHRFIGTIAALSILITAFGAAQVQARDRSTEQALAAILGLAVIGAIIAKQSDSVPKVEKVVPRPKPIEARPLPRDLSRDLHRDLPRNQSRDLHRKHGSARQALPQQCLREISTKRGPARVFGVRCMDRNYGYVSRLPKHCERRMRTDRGVRYGWEARCLRSEGYRVARH